MTFKSDQVRDEYAKIPTFLALICSDFVRISYDCGVNPVCVRVLEAIPGDSGVHEAGRAVDFRDEHDGNFLYPEALMLRIVDVLNKKYARNDGKPTVLWHSFNGAPHHFHIQMAADMNVYAKKES